MMAITLFWTVLFCLGLYTITQEGQILHFLRKPFDNNSSNLEVINERLNHFKLFDKSLVGSVKWIVIKRKLIQIIGKPFIHCITCMASIWGLIMFITLNGLHFNLIPAMIINSISASFIQTFIWNFYIKYIE